MRFGTRLALFLTLALTGVQALTVVVGCAVTREQITQTGQAELEDSARLFNVQLHRHFARAGDGVKVLSLDYALRSAIAHSDMPTIKSALSNHGRRTGATRMMLVNLDGQVREDTGADRYREKAFPFADLLGLALEGGQSSAIANVDGTLQWVIVATVDAPEPIAFVIACVPINNSLLSDLRSTSALHTSIALISTDSKGLPTALAFAGDAFVQHPLPSTVLQSSRLTDQMAKETNGHLVSVLHMNVALGSAAISAVFDYPMVEALRHYDAVLYPLLAVFVVGLLTAIAGAILIARRISRPIEGLAIVAQRFQEGHYDTPAPKSSDGEVLRLSSALFAMARAISQREVELKGAIIAAQTARSDAEAANRAKSNFLASMSHEIRTPLNAVLGLSGVLLDADLPADELYKIRLIKESGESLLDILNDILDLSKLESGRFEPEMVDFEPLALTLSCVELFGQRAANKGLKLHCVPEPSLPERVCGDSAHIRQILLNLIGNAIKFTEEGEVKVIVCGVENSNGRSLSWTVQDTGIGISPDRINKLFQPFEQADSSISRRFGGTGLGLAICKRLVAHMGGSISITSEPHHGTTFQVIVPIDPPVSAEAPPSLETTNCDFAEIAAKANRKLRILIAEDNATNQYVARSILEGSSVQVDVANNGLEAVNALRDRPYDLVFMDLQMPEMDGLTATRVIRAAGGPASKVPIIGFSANAYASDIRACTDAGMNGFVAKPVRKELLRKAAAAALSGSVVVPLAMTENRIDHSNEIVALDQAKFDELIEDLGEALAHKLVRSFVADASVKLAELPRALSDVPRLKIEVHALKSASAQMGATKMSRIAANLEKRCVNGEIVTTFDIAELRLAFDEFETHYKLLSITPLSKFAT